MPFSITPFSVTGASFSFASGTLFQFNFGGKNQPPRVELSAGYNPDPLPVGQPSFAALLSWRNLGSAFRGREAALNALVAWATSDRLASVKVLSGEGGVGKTALAAKLATDLRTKKWSAGFTHSLRTAASYDSGKNGTLLIVDYPEHDIDAVREFLKVVEAERANPSFKKLKRFRILLLSRDPLEAWLDRTGLKDSGIFDATPLPLDDSPRDAYAMFEALLAEANRVIDVSAPAVERQMFRAWFDSGAAENRRPLYIAAAAVHHADHWKRTAGQSATFGIRGRDIIVALAERELQKLREISESATVGLDAWALPLLSAHAAMTGGLVSEQLQAIHESDGPPAVPSAADLTPKLDKVGLWKGTEEESGTPYRFPPPEPDVLAAALVVHVLRQHEKFSPPAEIIWQAINLSRDAFPLTNLERLMHDSENALEMGQNGEGVLSGWFEGFVDHAINAGTLEARELLVGLDTLSQRAPTQGFLRAMIEARQHLVGTEDEPENKAVFLNNLSNDLSAAGRSAEALAAIEEAVKVNRGLASENPARFAPDLASSLNNLSVHLSAAGRHAEALAAIEEAVKVYRGLASANPARFAPDLAGSLNNLSGCLSDAGRNAEALAAVEEAVAIRRGLASENPARYAPDLASNLNNLSLRLSDAGRNTEALAAIEEAVEIRRGLASENPARYAPELATSLNNLSNRLSDAGRHAEALAAVEEAVKVYRGLASANPARYAPDLATSLGARGQILRAAGRVADAIASFEEGAELVRPFVEQAPQSPPARMFNLLEKVLDQTRGSLDRGETSDPS
ncbi:MAG: tetratricopeptide repeat protein [Alphaproteobacteria bacterium]